MINKYLKPDAVILAGGRGTRIDGYLHNKQKCIVNFNNKPFLSYILRYLGKFDLNKIYILTGYKSEEIYKRYHNKKINFVKIICVKEKKPMGTGGAISKLRKMGLKNFYLLNGDSIIDININRQKKTIKKNSIGVFSLIKNNNYKTNKKLNNLNLKKKRLVYSNKNALMNAGVYYFKKKILRLIPSKKISLEDEIVPKLINKKLLDGYKFSNKTFLDIGTPNNFLNAERHLIKNFRRPAAFLDRDGVINKDFNYVYKYKNFSFRNGVIKGLKLLIKKKYFIFIVTNQAGIAKKYFSIQNFEDLHLKIKQDLSKKDIFFDDVKFCPHHPKGIIRKYKIKCKCRKPSNKMIIDLIKEWDIDLRKSFMIGDKKKDQLCAKKSKIRFEYAEKNFFDQINSILKQT